MFKKYRYFRYLNVALIILLAIFLFSHTKSNTANKEIKSSQSLSQAISQDPTHV